MDVASGSLQAKRELAAALRERALRQERREYEASLAQFVRASWSSIDSSSYQDSWALDALCEHLEAVTRGHIRRLLINFPPRCGKSNVTTICWPAWTWAQPEEQKSFVCGAHVRFLCGSYNHTLSLKHSNSSRRLLTSPFYQQFWGDRYTFMGDQNSKHQFDNSEGGSRIATSVGGSLIGIGGDVLLVDDPHNTDDVESETERENVLRWWKELRSTRLNDPKQSAIVVVMQRLHQEDVSGVILEDSDTWTHLMLPMRHIPNRHCVTVLKWDDQGQAEQTWEDPRDPEGHDLMWPERFGEPQVKMLETELGPQMASGRLQQVPSPVGGGIFKDDWWGNYMLPVGGQYKHPFVVRVASLDPAFTAKQENDPSGFSVWGVYNDDRGNPRALMMQAWEKWLELHGEDVPQAPQEKYSEWVHRAKAQWGLVEWVAYECLRHNVQYLLIEDKASGHSVAQEFRRLHSDNNWSVMLLNPGTQDKRARAYSVQHLFANGRIVAPSSIYQDEQGNETIQFRDWAANAIKQASNFRGLPGDEDNFIDSMTQCLRWLRDMGYLLRADEKEARDRALATHKRSGPRPSIYGV